MAGQIQQKVKNRHKEVAKKMIVDGCTAKEAMIDVGYSETYAHNPHKVTKQETFKKEYKKLEDALEASIWQAMAAMTDKIDKAKYGELSAHVDRAQKLINLGRGDSTDNSNITITWE